MLRVKGKVLLDSSFVYYKYYLAKKVQRLEHSAFFSFSFLKLEVELSRRATFNGALSKFHKCFNEVFRCLKYDFFTDARHLFLTYVECFSLLIYLRRKGKKKANVPLDKRYRIGLGRSEYILYRGCRIFVSNMKIKNKGLSLFFKLYYELLNFLFQRAESFVGLTYTLTAVFVNRRQF